MSIREKLDEFTLGYVICALWASNDESTPAGGEPLDKNYDIEDIAPQTMHQMIADCQLFQRENLATLNAAFEHPDYRRVPDSWPMQTAGHDFWLTRNGHGVGFWDGDYPKELGDQLTAAAKKYPEVTLYLGDDQLIYAA